MSALCCWPPSPPDTDAVSSVFGRTGAVVAVAGDYTSTLITNSSAVPGGTVTAALNALNGQVTFAAVKAALAAASSAVDFNGQAITALSFGGVKLATNVANGAMRVGETAMTTGVSGATGVGVGALNALTTGVGNTALGREAMTVVTTGQQNTAIGSRALFTNVVGSDNCAVGTAALRNTTGDQNTGLGSLAGFSVTTGAGNTFAGYNAGSSDTTGSDNTALGATALGGVTTGLRNVGVGGLAGYVALVTGSDNTIVGYNAHPNGDRSNCTLIGKSAGTSVAANGHICLGMNANPIAGDAGTANLMNLGDTIYADMTNKKVRMGTPTTIVGATSVLGLFQAGADSSAVLSLNTQGSNAGNSNFFVGTRNPSGAVSANAGAIYVRQNGATSGIYINRSAADPGTTWAFVTAI